MSRKVLTKAQRRALHNLWLRTVHEVPPINTYKKFRKSAWYDGLCDCLMVPFCGMLCGIETGGYTHS